MKKKINLNQFKNLVKRIIKEEKNNLTKRKTVRITESQLRNQVRKMLREYDDEYDMVDDERYDRPEGEKIERDAEEIILPSGGLMFFDWSAEEDSSGKEDHSWDIKNVEYYPNPKEDKGYPIDIYDPKNVDVLKMIEKYIIKWLKGEGWYSRREYDDPDTYHQPQI